MEKFNSFKVGSSLVELIMAITIFSIVVFTLITAIVYGLESIALSGDRNRAVLLAEEGIEASHNIRDEDFANLATGVYGLDSGTGEWLYSGASDTTGKFTREIELNELSANIYEVISRVSWDQTAVRPGEVTLVSRLTNWVLEVSGIGDWSLPIFVGSNDIPGSNNGFKVDVSGSYAYIVRNGGTPDFVVVDVSNPALPLIVGSASVSGGPRDIEVVGNYAYIASTSNGSELVVYDISNPLLPVVVDTLNLAGNDNGIALDVDGTVLYMVRQGGTQQVVSIDITDPTNVSVLDTINATGSSRDIEVEDGFAYVSSNSDTSELEIFDISDPSNMVFVDGYNYGGNADIDALEIFDEFVIAGRSDGEIWIADFSDFNVPILLSIYDGLDDINDMDMGNENNYIFVGSDDNSIEMQVVDITNKAAPFLLGSYNAGGDINGVFYDEVTDRYYGVGDSNTQELIILDPS